jgi:hypothetical protein
VFSIFTVRDNDSHIFERSADSAGIRDPIPIESGTLFRRIRDPWKEAR